MGLTLRIVVLGLGLAQLSAAVRGNLVLPSGLSVGSDNITVFDKADEPALKEYHRLAASETERYVTQGKWFIEALGEKIQLRCANSETCAEAVKQDIAVQIEAVASGMPETKRLELAERAMYGCGQGASNSWFVHLTTQGLLPFTIGSTDQACNIIIKRDGAAAYGVSISTVDHKVFKDGTCRDEAETVKTSGVLRKKTVVPAKPCPRFGACIRNEITGKDIEPYPAMQWLISSFDHVTLAAAEGNRSSWYMTHASFERSLEKGYIDAAELDLSDCFEKEALLRSQ